jgi:uncharacterized protein
MSPDAGQKAIDRGLASLVPGGVLELAFFGGEPLLEAALISRLVSYARRGAADAGVRLSLGLTTNGTLTDPAARALIMMPDLDLAVSCDGLPDVHDLYRRHADGAPTSGEVLALLGVLLAAGKPFRVVTVVRPQTAWRLPEGVEFLADLGIRHIEPTLDLWTPWSAAQARALRSAIFACAETWRGLIPELAIGWLDEKAALLAGVQTTPTARCGFGVGQVAVSASGRLYPCERLIADDDDANPMRLPGNVFNGEDFLPEVPPPAPARSPAPSGGACAACGIRAFCSAGCACSNFVRTGDTASPDGLLCLLNRTCLAAVAWALGIEAPAADTSSSRSPVGLSRSERRTSDGS